MDILTKRDLINAMESCTDDSKILIEHEGECYAMKVGLVRMATNHRIHLKIAGAVRNPKTDKIVEAMSLKFCEIIMGLIGIDKLIEMSTKNAMINQCPSWAYVDPTVVMDEAFKDVMKRGFSHLSETDAVVFRDSWIHARERDYFIKELKR